MFQEFVPLDPVNFFALSLDCFACEKGKLEKRHLLPDLSAFHIDSPFADLFMGWHEEGLYFSVHIRGEFKSPYVRSYALGDSVELFIDTRDMKTTGYTTRFCHHFYFLPEMEKGEEEVVLAAEVTRFRGEEAHALAAPSTLKVATVHDRRSARMEIFIPSECLHGYDPAQFNRLGFTYRINRHGGAKQLFFASDNVFAIESQPSLWASLNLRK